MVSPLKGFIFLCKIGKSLLFRGCKTLGKSPDFRSRWVSAGWEKDFLQFAFSFLREAKQSVLTGGAEDESENYLSLHGVQTA